MKDEDLRRYLDGETGADTLDEEALAEARSWERLVASFRAERPGAPAPAWLEDRVMAEIGALPEPGALRRAWSWLLRPRPIRLSPATLGLAAAAVVAIVLLPGRRGPAPVTQVPGADATVGTVVYVQFDLRAPSAHSVAVGGDFDEWRGSYPLEDPDGDGIWTGRVPVKPGLHSYMFLVNGSRWVTDPEAAHYTDDGFGNRNAVVAVTAPVT